MLRQNKVALRPNLPFLALRQGGSRRGSLSPIYEDGRGSSTGAAPLPLPGSKDAGLSAIEKMDSLECIETIEDSYTVKNASEACWRVLFRNAPAGDPIRREKVKIVRKKYSLLGTYGHIERANAWTHVIGALVFLVWSIVRPLSGLDTESAPAQLSAAASVLAIVVFVVSSCYHVFATVRRFAPWLRMSDHASIYIGLAVACLTDVAIATRSFSDMPWQTAADACGVAAVLLGFFLYRRSVLPPEATELAWGECKLGLFRFQHSDFEFGALRSAGYVVLSFSWLLLVPVGFANLRRESAVLILICNSISVALLVLGLLLDNVAIQPDLSYEDAFYLQKKRSIPCNSRTLGCICTSHALWHVATLLSLGVLTVGREIVIANEDFD